MPAKKKTRAPTKTSRLDTTPDDHAMYLTGGPATTTYMHLHRKPRQEQQSSPVSVALARQHHALVVPRVGVAEEHAPRAARLVSEAPATGPAPLAAAAAAA